MPTFYINPLSDEMTENSDIGQLDGKYVQYIGNRKIMEYNYLNQEKHGTEIGWYLNGNMWYIHNYEKGKRVGLQKGWRSNGDVWYVHNYH